MQLQTFMAKTGVSDKQIADLAGVTRGYITQLRLGIRKRPSLGVALRIEKATDGRVPVQIWGIE